MGGGFAPRFVFEAVFLILLAVAAGFADLRPLVVVAVMAGGWLLVVLIEYFTWRASAQTALRVAALAQRPEPAQWSVDEILVPEAELAAAEPEPAALTTVLAPDEALPEEEAPAGEAEAGPEPEPARKRRLFRRRGA